VGSHRDGPSEFRLGLVETLLGIVDVGKDEDRREHVGLQSTRFQQFCFGGPQRPAIVEQRTEIEARRRIVLGACDGAPLRRQRFVDAVEALQRVSNVHVGACIAGCGVDCSAVESECGLEIAAVFDRVTFGDQPVSFVDGFGVFHRLQIHCFDRDTAFSHPPRSSAIRSRLA
ncbi:MAG: hypothetical protein WCB48_12485, partial [Casimicrobiaceae bacterium]